eukprot:g3882.t1
MWGLVRSASRKNAESKTAPQFSALLESLGDASKNKDSQSQAVASAAMAHLVPITSQITEDILKAIDAHTEGDGDDDNDGLRADPDAHALTEEELQREADEVRAKYLGWKKRKDKQRTTMSSHNKAAKMLGVNEMT